MCFRNPNRIPAPFPENQEMQIPAEIKTNINTGIQAYCSRKEWDCQEKAGERAKMARGRRRFPAGKGEQEKIIENALRNRVPWL